MELNIKVMTLSISAFECYPSNRQSFNSVVDYIQVRNDNFCSGMEVRNFTMRAMEKLVLSIHFESYFGYALCSLYRSPPIQ